MKNRANDDDSSSFKNEDYKSDISRINHTEQTKMGLHMHKDSASGMIFINSYHDEQSVNDYEHVDKIKGERKFLH